MVYFKKILIAVLATVAATSVFSQPQRPGPNVVSVSVVPRATEAPLKEYFSEGYYYIAGNKGEVYDLVISNNTRGRIKAVISIDGLNVISGKKADINKEGYILGPFESSKITGWRKSLTETAQFYFSTAPDSYAARTDQSIDNLGVIGVAAFEEDIKVIPFGGVERLSKSGAPAPGAAAEKSFNSADAQLGTGHGQRENSSAVEVSFKALPRPSQIYTVYYDSYRNLVRKGVIQERRDVKPNPFPATSNFAPDPRH